uniref:Endonuclease-reverse transcriptase n=1 Tax=Plectus sambesii TaxID=2011161 RepID=A0A914XBD6_9BILA
MIYTSKQTPMSLKRKLFNSCVLPAMLYGAETWLLTKREENRLAVAQRRMERIMAGISLREQKTNDWFRKLTRLSDVVRLYWQRKWRWAQRIARMDEDRWGEKGYRVAAKNRKAETRKTEKAMERRNHKLGGVNWMAIARNDEDCWQQLEEEFLRRL